MTTWKRPWRSSFGTSPPAAGDQTKGTAECVTESPVFGLFCKIAQETFRGTANAKGSAVRSSHKGDPWHQLESFIVKHEAAWYNE